MSPPVPRQLDWLCASLATQRVKPSSRSTDLQKGGSIELQTLRPSLVRLNVDIIVVAGGDTQVRAAKNATKTIPIVMVGQGADPVEAGLVESIARPGGNVTGITLLNRELGGKRLELLKEAVPKLSRVAVLYDPANRNNERELKEVLPVAARALGLTIQPWQIRDASGFEKEFTAMGRQRADGLYATEAARKCLLSKTNRELCIEEPVTVDVFTEKGCRGRWAHVLRGGPRGQLPARRILRGQNPEGSEACRTSCRAAHEVRAGD